MKKLYIATGSSFASAIQNGDEWIVKTALDGKGVQCLAIDPNDQQTIYVGTYGQGVWKSGDGGSHWEDMNFPQANVFSIAVSPADGSVYVGCEPSRLYRSRDSGQSWQELLALLSLPSAPTWSFPPRPWTSHVRWIAPNPKDPDLLLVGIELGGVMYSKDGGQSWSDHRPGAQRDVHALAWHPKDAKRAYEAGGGGAAWSHDGGWTWKPADEGRDRHYTWALAVDPHDPDTWYITASPSPYHAHSGYFHETHNAKAYVYRWQGKGPWEPMSSLKKTQEIMPYVLATLEGELYVGFSDGSVYMSNTAKDTWQPLNLKGDHLKKIAAMVAVE